ncbi:ricin-type beta-trefoil lectin domain protein [Streptomyces goshikiensis]|uniref:ricin-type beta-trefoil lectin domain protein n=1 Tax=Streptomyces goshikiensis TaxID=1942 RepID=UPI0036666B02
MPRTTSGRRRARRNRLAVGTATAAALLVTLVPSQALAAPPSGSRAGVDLIDLQKEPVARDAGTGALDELTGEATQPVDAYVPEKTDAPAGGQGTAPLTTPAAGQLVKADQLPVLIGPPKDATAAEAAALAGNWQVALAQPEQTAAAEVDGMLLTVTPPAGATGEVEVSLDYSEFKELYSADWANRLQFVQYPRCFLQSPDNEACNEAVRLNSDNNDDSDRISTTVDVASLTAPATAPQSAASFTTGGSIVDGVYRTSRKAEALRTLMPAATGGATGGVFATVDSGSGAKGDYTATPLVSAGTWSAGGNSGAFNYTYQLTAPPAPAGPAPSIAFQYNSQVVDGRTSATNNQASWLGDGWEYNPGSIERTYRGCSDDTAGGANNASHKTGDLCWGSWNAVLSLGGSTTELVRDDTSGQWVTKNGDGSKIQLIKDSAKPKANGDDDDERWIVTTRDGTQYHFGLNRLPGWADGKSTTDSVLTVPVSGNQPGEPCYNSDFSKSFCDQAWRWNLDYVVDVDGNAMSLWWKKETNFYSKNEKYTTPVKYDRGGYLLNIDYGQRSDTLFSAPPVDRVSFGVGERCREEGALKCTDAAFASRDYEQYRIWYDTPAHLYCSGTVGKRCPVPSPTFWSRKQLSSVTTQAQRTKGSTALQNVDTWNLTQSFPRTLTEGSPPLWLESVKRTGYGTDGKSLPLNPVEFSHNNAPMPNRVVKGPDDHRPAFDRLRIRRVMTEYGGEIDVQYSTPSGSCASGTGQPAPEANKGLCYPVFWSPDPDQETTDWFNKYVVESVEERPRIDGVPDLVTDYVYAGDAAWAKNDTEFSKRKTRTYDQWHGYAQVDVLKGRPDATDGSVQSKSSSRFFRGMPGQTVLDSKGATIAADHPAFQGMTAESISYTQAVGGEVSSRSISYPKAIPLASRARGDGLDALTAYRVENGKSTTITPSSGTGDDKRTSRTATITTEYDSAYGLPEKVESQGDTGVTGDETCTVSEYLHNTTAHLIGLVKQVRTTVGSCAQAATAAVVTASRTAYDGGAYGAAPTRGLATTEWSNDAAGTGWIRSSVLTHDSYGRVRSVEDAAGRTATSSYDPPTGQVYATTSTNAAGKTSTGTVDPGRSTGLTVKDVNGKVTAYAYDALGRATGMWAPSQNPATDAPAKSFSYYTKVGKPVSVTTSVLRDDDTRAESTTFYDGLGRVRQSRKNAVGGGWMVSDTYYNEAGQIRRTDNGYLAEKVSADELFEKKSDFQVPNSTVTTYDGQGQPLTVTPLYAGVAQTARKTTYGYGWDYTTVTPPTGAAKTRTWTDALGRAVRVDHYNSTAPGGLTSTRYGFDVRGNRVSAKDAKNNEWSWKFDARGREIEATDPDTGTRSQTYDDLDQPVLSTNSRGIKVWTGYDVLGRVTGQRLNDANGEQLTAFGYDAVVGAVGQPSSATRYTGGVAYTSTITGYDAEYRPTGKSITVPDTAATKGVAGTYAYGYTYTRSGLRKTTTVPAVGSLPQEKVVTRYNQEGLPVSTSGTDWYTADTTYSPYGEVLRAVTGEQPYRVWTTNVFDEGSGWATQMVTDRETADAHRVNERAFRYDNAGNITLTADKYPSSDAANATVTTDRQCFIYDGLGQLTEAWTSPHTECKAPGQTTRQPVYKDATGAVVATNVTDANEGYWHSYAYDVIGNRTKLVEHDATPTLTAGQVDTAGDTTKSYSYGIDPSGSGVLKQPHTLTGLSTDTPTVDTTASMGYDSAGNTTTRTYGGDGAQALTWTWDGKPEKVTGTGKDGVTQVNGLAGKCLDLSNGDPTTGSPIQLFQCNGTKAQQFRLDGDGTAPGGKTGALKIRDNCVMPTGGGTGVGTTITVAPCTGAANQKWTTAAGDGLKHVASGLCMDVPGGNEANGTDVFLYNCNGGPNQSWKFEDTTSYVYDADGSRLIASTAGTNTLYLPESEYRTSTTGTLVYCQRYYSQAGAPTVVRNSELNWGASSLTAIISDQHGTPVAGVDLGSGQNVQRIRTEPFGTERSSSAAFRSHRGYVGGGDDNSTGLTHLGARLYDSTTGRFVSADPVIDLGDPLQMNGYAYAANNPVTLSDPSGLMPNPKGGCPVCFNPPSTTTPAPTPPPSTSSTTTQTVSVTVTKTVTVRKPPKDCNWWCKTKGWLREHKEVVSFVVEIAVSGACFGAAVAGAVETAGATLVAAAGCGALGAAAGASVNNALTPEADHSTLGILKDQAKALAPGAASGVMGLGVGKVLERGAGAIASKLLSTKPARAGSGASGPGAAAPGKPPAMADDYNPADWKPTVTHEDGATAIGNDPNTMKALAFAPREKGVHNVVMHGHPNGLPKNTPYTVVADAIRANPSYKEGMACRLIMCYGGNHAMPMFKLLRADVDGYSTTLIVNPDGSFAGGGKFQGFSMKNDADWALD